jgi:hypothetical protein
MGLRWEPGEKATVAQPLSHPIVLQDQDDAAKLGKGRYVLFALNETVTPPTVQLLHSGDAKSWTPLEATGLALASGDVIRVAWQANEKRWLLIAGNPEGDSKSLFPVYVSNDLKKWTKLSELELPAFTALPALAQVSDPSKGNSQASWLITANGKAYPLPKLDAKSKVDASKEKFLEAGTFGTRSESGWQPIRLNTVGGAILSGEADYLGAKGTGATIALIPTQVQQSGNDLVRRWTTGLQKKLDAVKQQTHDLKKGELTPKGDSTAEAFALVLDAEMDDKGRLDLAIGALGIQFEVAANQMKIGRTRNYENAVSTKDGKKRVQATLIADGGWLTIQVNNGLLTWSGPLPKSVAVAPPVVAGTGVKSLSYRFTPLP